MCPSNDDTFTGLSLTDTPYERLQENFRTHGWHFEANDEKQLVMSNINGESAQFRVLAAVAKESLLQIIVTYPVLAPAAKRVEAAEFCTRATYGLDLGSMQLDMSDGMIRFHVGVPFADGDLPASVIEHCMGSVLIMADHYFPHLMSVLYGGVTPAHAARVADQALEAARA